MFWFRYIKMKICSLRSLNFFKTPTWWTLQRISTQNVSALKPQKVVVFFSVAILSFVWQKKRRITKQYLAAMKAKRAEVVKKLKELNAACKPLVDVIDDLPLVTQLRNDKNFTIEYLSEKHNVPAECLNYLYQHAKFLYECGNYSWAANYLNHFRLLSTDASKNFNALWGKLAAEILMQNWTTASEDLKTLREAIELKVIFFCMFCLANPVKL